MQPDVDVDGHCNGDGYDDGGDNSSDGILEMMKKGDLRIQANCRAGKFATPSSTTRSGELVPTGDEHIR